MARKVKDGVILLPDARYAKILISHRPLVLLKAGLARVTEFAERGFFVENREVRILHKASSHRPEGLLSVGISPTGTK